MKCSRKMLTRDGSIPPPLPPGNVGGWAPWPQHNIEGVDDNELNLVNHLANAAMDNAAANGLMQHPEISQDSHSISSDTKAFLKAEGPPVTLELPLPTGPMPAESSQSGTKIAYILMMMLLSEDWLPDLVSISALVLLLLCPCLFKNWPCMHKLFWPLHL
jgi:hypothetical protein